MSAIYCWPQSVYANEDVQIYAHCEHEGEGRVRVTRVGRENSVVRDIEGVELVRQAIPHDAASEGCNWRITTTLRADLETGFYLVEVINEVETSFGFFVVKPSTVVDAMLVLSTSTWAAYNNWGGPSFYTGGHTSSLKRPLPPGFLSKNNLQRFRQARLQDWTPIEHKAFASKGYSQWSMAAGWANWEYLFVQWAEAAGYKLGFATSQDLIDDPEVLDQTNLYLSVGHDEYWTREMRDCVENFVDHGGNAAFFSGNVAFWQARLEADKLVCYKMKPEEDPLAGSELTTTMWSDPLVGRPENEMTGVSFTRGGYARMNHSPMGTGGYRVQHPEHWAFANTELQRDGLVGANAVVVGYECDGCAVENRRGEIVPTHLDGTPEGFQILAHAPARLWETKHLPQALRDDYVGELNWVAERVFGEDSADNRALLQTGYAVMGTFQRGQGTVFTTGCTDWAYGLSDPQVAQITKNVLDYLA